MTPAWSEINNLPTLFHPQIFFSFPFCCYSLNSYGMYSEWSTHHLLAVFSSINFNQTHNMDQTPQELDNRMNKVCSLFFPRQCRRNPANIVSFHMLKWEGTLKTSHQRFLGTGKPWTEPWTKWGIVLGLSRRREGSTRTQGWSQAVPGGKLSLNICGNQGKNMNGHCGLEPKYKMSTKFINCYIKYDLSSRLDKYVFMGFWQTGL